MLPFVLNAGKGSEVTDEMSFSSPTPSSSWQEAADAIIRGLQSIGTEHQLGFLYVTDAFADSLKEIYIFLGKKPAYRTGSVRWDLASAPRVRNILEAQPWR